VARLTKHDVEQLMDLVDREPVPVLTRMLGKVLDQPDARWETLVALAGFSPDRAAKLLDRDREALDELAAELNELRGLDRR
jgi:hypothetical protein